MEVIFSLDLLCLQEDIVAIRINRIVIALALTPSITWAFVLTCYLWIPPLSETKDSANSMALSAALTKKLISTMRWLAFINIQSYLHCIAEFPTPPQNIKPSKKPNVQDSITFDLPKQIQQSRKRIDQQNHHHHNDTQLPTIATNYNLRLLLLGLYGDFASQ